MFSMKATLDFEVEDCTGRKGSAKLIPFAEDVDVEIDFDHAHRVGMDNGYDVHAVRVLMPGRAEEISIDPAFFAVRHPQIMDRVLQFPLEYHIATMVETWINDPDHALCQQADLRVEELEAEAA